MCGQSSSSFSSDCEDGFLEMSGAGPAVLVGPGTGALSMSELDHHPLLCAQASPLPSHPSQLLNMGGSRASVGTSSSLEGIAGPALQSLWCSRFIATPKPHRVIPFQSQSCPSILSSSRCDCLLVGKGCFTQLLSFMIPGTDLPFHFHCPVLLSSVLQPTCFPVPSQMFVPVDHYPCPASRQNGLRKGI